MESKMKKLSMAEKAKKAGLPAQTVYNRMHNGWTEKRALSVPNGNYKKKTVAYKVEPSKVQTPAKAVGTSTPKATKTTDSAGKYHLEGSITCGEV